jgi:hypothetical protein
MAMPAGSAMRTATLRDRKGASDCAGWLCRQICRFWRKTYARSAPRRLCLPTTLFLSISAFTERQLIWGHESDHSILPYRLLLRIQCLTILSAAGISLVP